MSLSQETLYMQEMAHLARAWTDAEIDIHEYRAQRARLLDAFEDAMNDSTRPYPPGRRKNKKPGQQRGVRRWFRFWPAMVVTLLVGMVTTAVWFVA